ncbi:uncharacterized protein BDZ99DRAFT_427077 [Mytilinidion resinicola]|uniref:DUF1772-domain-containing protein n=1 Tax=Mytilinidion resinicola TaxID=574789 RepID=A0A6A6Y744_9PEZI|nr:uncharacterized protein BDZ99DRAFT_427077 [Mytilinidion resinicola]KAF2803627.1 hypothetical protein BDZ99DRAFT_427077 [Mytilinidion resinicola]
MPSPTVALCKFVGTISLGLLTGVSASLTSLTLPSLFNLPSAVNARDALTYLSTRTRTVTTYLRNTALISLFAAYALSPRSSRHPYLFYTSLLALASGSGVDFALAAQDKRAGGSRSHASIADLNVETPEDLNGEQVRQAVEGMRYTEGMRAAVSGLAFAMGVVGIWGDGA